VEELRLRVRPDVGFAEALAQRRLASPEGAQVAFGVELGGQSVDPHAVTQSVGRLAARIVE